MIDYPPFVFRALYWYLGKIDRHNQLITMNYGYANNGNAVRLAPEDELNRYPLQLYHHMAEKTVIRGRDLVEVGSGRGGGLAYVYRTFNPASVRGIDLEKTSVRFSNNQFGNGKLRFIHGDALSIPLADESCDVLLNVESSHRYRSMKIFLSEAYRILRNDGDFLYTDFRYDHEWPEVIRLIGESGFRIVSEEDITSNILESLDYDSERRQELIRKYAPRILWKGIKNFSGSAGSQTYKYFTDRKFIYKSFIIRKVLN
jgi:SAM-dependent methyltransferase